MAKTLSIADLYFIQEFAKLATSDDGVLNARQLKTDVRSIISCNCNQQEQRAQRSTDVDQEDLESEHNPLLIQYFAEEFARLETAKPTPRPGDSVPSLFTSNRLSSARHLTQRRLDAEDVTARRRSAGDLDMDTLDTLDRSYLLFTSEAYLYFKD